jgi:hypothetical protein
MWEERNMKIAIITSLVLSIVIVFVSFEVSGQEIKRSAKVTDILKKLRDEGKTGEKQEKELLTHRKELVDGLIEIVKVKLWASDKDENDWVSSDKVIARCAYLLGELRAEEAVGVLFDNIKFTTWKKKPGKNFPPIEEAFHCVRALIKIGKPASLEVVKRLPSVSDGVKAVLCYHILKEVEGKEVAHFLLTGRLKELKGKERENLQAFLKEHFSEEEEGEEEKEDKDGNQDE